MNLVGKGFALNVPTVDHDNVNVENFCKPKCTAESNCVTFDEVDMGEYTTCRFSNQYGPLDDMVGGDHWERRRWCTSLTGKSNPALYLCVYVCVCMCACVCVCVCVYARA